MITMGQLNILKHAIDNPVGWLTMEHDILIHRMINSLAVRGLLEVHPIHKDRYRLRRTPGSQADQALAIAEKEMTYDTV